MSWFKRLKDGIQTTTNNKKEVPDGVWSKCKGCGEATTYKTLKEALFICPSCDYHYRIGSHDYFDFLFDGKYVEHFNDLESIDILEFKDLQAYPERLAKAKKKTKLSEAITVASGKISKNPIIIAAMDFTGVTASFAMLGDVNFSEPGALIGFAGPRVIKETIKKELPEGFQRSEYVMNSGFLDFIVHRTELKTRIADLLSLFSKSANTPAA